jgi:Leucine-rich repeat (LRR) protein
VLAAKVDSPHVDAAAVTKQLSHVKIDVSKAKILFVGRQDISGTYSTTSIAQEGLHERLLLLDLSGNTANVLDSYNWFYKHLSKAVALRVLNISNCSQLEELPAAFSSLRSFQELHARGCSQLRSLPKSIGKLAELRVLDLSGCSELIELPASMCQLAALQVLRLSNCEKLQQLS